MGFNRIEDMRAVPNVSPADFIVSDGHGATGRAVPRRGQGLEKARIEAGRKIGLGVVHLLHLGKRCGDVHSKLFTGLGRLSIWEGAESSPPGDWALNQKHTSFRNGD